MAQKSSNTIKLICEKTLVLRTVTLKHQIQCFTTSLLKTINTVGVYTHTYSSCDKFYCLAETYYTT